MMFFAAHMLYSRIGRMNLRMGKNGWKCMLPQRPLSPAKYPPKSPQNPKFTAITEITKGNTPLPPKFPQNPQKRYNYGF